MSEDKKKILNSTSKNKKAKDEPREVSDKKLEKISGGTVPIIKPF